MVIIAPEEMPVEKIRSVSTLYSAIVQSIIDLMPTESEPVPLREAAEATSQHLLERVTEG